MCGLVCTRVGSCGLVWTRVGSCGLLWARVGPSGAAGARAAPFEVLRSPGAEKPSEAEKRDPSRPRAPALALSKPKMLVISGGDGYEDFRLTSSSETVGRDDSTNHLLLWRA